MSYSDYLDEICNEYLSKPFNVSEVFAELSDEKIADLVERLPELRKALVDELKTWKGPQTKAKELEAFYKAHSGSEDDAYERRRQEDIDRRNV